jgi:hypothetical protein
VVWYDEPQMINARYLSFRNGNMTRVMNSKRWKWFLFVSAVVGYTQQDPLINADEFKQACPDYKQYSSKPQYVNLAMHQLIA